MGLCNWNPRDWEKISEDGQEEMANLLNRVEEVKCWPGSLLQTTLVRIPKQESGHRLIGLLGTLYRVWEVCGREALEKGGKEVGSFWRGQGGEGTGSKACSLP